MKNIKHRIQVRNYLEREPFKRHVFQEVETIKRKLTSCVIGNFNPVFCRYMGKEYLVSSDEGDISDPFRADESYLNSLFIDVTGINEKTFSTDL